MLLRAPQRLVRLSPRGAMGVWERVPEAARRRIRPWVYPIAVGRRGGGRVIVVPAAPPGTLLEVTPPVVSVVIVTFDNPELVAHCLRSLRRPGAAPGAEVVVVDNGRAPPAEDVRVLASRWIRPGENLGFARAVNVGVADTSAPVVVVLNDDTVVPPGVLGRLVSHLERDPELGLVCPVTNEIGSDARVEAFYGTYEELLAFSEDRATRFAGQLRRTELVPLFCAALRRSLLGEVGGLDERYDVGMFEDDDLSLAVRRAGYHLGVAEDAFVHHVGQASFSRLPDTRYLRIWQANRRRFEEKWGRRWKPPGGR